MPKMVTEMKRMDKVDLKKELKELYNPSSKEVSFVDVPDFNYLMIDGQGDPRTSPDYMATFEPLFGVSYALKFMVKKAKGVDYGVMPLEGLWWADDLAAFKAQKRTDWKWTSMIMQPKYVTADDVKAAIEQVRKKKAPSALDKLRFECFHEGKAAQIMHIGPYVAEGPNIQKIHAAIKASGHQLSGKHHEIYLNNPQKTAPEKLKTVLRQPMK